MELGEADEASGDLVPHFDSLEFGSFQTDLWELDYNGRDAPGRQGGTDFGSDHI